jgi:hypothetical protein
MFSPTITVIDELDQTGSAYRERRSHRLARRDNAPQHRD